MRVRAGLVDISLILASGRSEGTIRDGVEARLTR